MIASGLPATAMVSAEGEDAWRGIRTHAPFALALDQRAAAVARAQQPAPVKPPPQLSGRMAALIIAAVVLCGTCMAARSACTPQIITAKDMPPAPAPIQPPPASAEPVPSVAASVAKGTWAKIPMPGTDLPDTPENRARYMVQVASAVPGEPKINPKAAMPLLQRLRAELAKQASVPVSSITVAIGDASASVLVATGTMGGLKVHDEPRDVPVCSEMLFATSVITAGLSHEVFIKAGVRSILCKSDGCVGVMDTRPTSPGGGIYGGTSCLSLEEALRLELGR